MATSVSIFCSRSSYLSMLKEYFVVDPFLVSMLFKRIFCSRSSSRVLKGYIVVDPVLVSMLKEYIVVDPVLVSMLK